MLGGYRRSVRRSRPAPRWPTPNPCPPPSGQLHQQPSPTGESEIQTESRIRHPVPSRYQPNPTRAGSMGPAAAAAAAAAGTPMQVRWWALVGFAGCRSRGVDPVPEVGETEAEVEEVENARAWIGAAPLARSGSPPPNLPICAVRASFRSLPYPPVIHHRNRHRLPGEDN